VTCAPTCRGSLAVAGAAAMSVFNQDRGLPTVALLFLGAGRGLRRRSCDGPDSDGTRSRSAATPIAGTPGWDPGDARPGDDVRAGGHPGV
jgi:hypothetical protein